MKVTFPHMGTVYAPMQVLLRRVGAEVVVPPPCSSRSLALATQHSPEWVCIPYKLVLGNFLEAIEMGADTLILLGGPNNCRFGYYAKLQEKVLNDLGYQVEMVLPEISSRTINGLGGALKRLSGGKASTRDCIEAILLGLSALKAMDQIETRVEWVRARERQFGTADKVWTEALEGLAKVDSFRSLKSTKRHFLKRLEAVPIDEKLDPLKVCVVGEIYVVHEPYINMNLEVELGRRRVEVHRFEQVSQWLVPGPALLLEGLGLGHEARIARAASPYLEHLHGETIGQTVMASRQGYDGIVHLAPFTCTPEIVNSNVLPRLRQDIDIPVLELIVDDQTGRAGFITRLEAFIDCLEQRRRKGIRPFSQQAIDSALAS